jgi:hypothetical protein
LVRFLQQVAEKTPVQNYYVTISTQGKPDTLLLFQSIPLAADDLLGFDGRPNSLRARLLRGVVRTLMGRRKLKLLVNGNQLLTGCFGVISQASAEMRVAHLFSGIDYLRDRISHHAVLIKDVPIDNNSLNTKGYTGFRADPEMVLECHWASFEEYVASLKTKYRQRYQNTMNQSQQIKVRRLSADDVRRREQEIFELFEEVVTDGKFSLGELSTDYFSIFANLAEGSFFGYFLEEKLVGFRTSIRRNQDLIAHYVGYLQTENKERKIYQRILYDYVEEAILAGSKRLYLGRTALEIKSTLGAKPEELMLLLSVRNRLLRRLAKYFLKRLKPPEFIERSPFKA